MIQDSQCASRAAPGVPHTDTTQSVPLPDAFSGGGKHLKPAAQQECVGLRLQQACSSSMAVQEQAQGLWFEQLMPRPVNDIATRLQPDPVLKKTLQDPQASVVLYNQEVKNRKTMETRNEEYRFAPLLVTLDNMAKLTGHMLNDKQFAQPLAADEREVLLALQGHIRNLIALGAPYRRTVTLAFLMCMLQEIIWVRHVIEPLREAGSALCSRNRLTTVLFRRDSPGCSESTEIKAASIPLMEAFTCRWAQEIWPGQQCANTDLVMSTPVWLLRFLLNQCPVLVYPSFAPLDLEDFCGFGHLPVYPLGMMSAYALNADGYMQTPLAFFMHDVLHAYNSAAWVHMDVPDPAPLQGIRNRLGFQQLVQGSLPAALRQELKCALELVLFSLLHEENLDNAQNMLEHKSFLELFQQICNARRESFQSYSPVYRAVTDQQALLACFWTHQVYAHCRENPHEPGTCADSLVSRFVQKDRPALLEHQAFLDAHRAALHEYFLAEACAGCDVGDNKMLWYRTRGLPASCGGLRGKLLLENSGDENTQGVVRHTDLVYFNCLLADEECTRIEQKLKVRLPAGRPHRAPD
ncbi:MAG: hypothetical protein OXC07_01085 [Kistimonas sp.]|nr:hypothetical protein [Kistimonas sp.]